MYASCYEMGMYSDGDGGCFNKASGHILVRCGAFVGIGVAVEVLISL